jgi:ELWxxDGT repeat protein
MRISFAWRRARPRAITARRLSLMLFVMLVFGAAIASVPRAEAMQPGERCFAETGFCISGRIREYWEQNGGLPVFGLPLGPQQQELIEGRPIQAQWFERNRLELHPEHARPYDVLLGRLGADRLAQQGRPGWQEFPKAEPQGDCLSFETGHSACGAILAAWRANGLEFDGRPGASYAESLALFGLPLSSPTLEVLEGRAYSVQWFERARFELHPENAPPYDVLLGRLGAEIRAGGVMRISASAEIDGLTAAGGRVFFSARTPETGLELWASDGSAAGTYLVKDLLPGPDGGWPMHMVELGGRVLFAARGTPDGAATLWASDGSAAGTTELLPAAQLRDPWQLTRVGERVFFIADDGAHGPELWLTDGTAGGTRLVKEIYPGERGIYPEQNMPMGYIPHGLTRVGSQLYFHAETPGVGYALWRSDGSAGGTQLVTRLGDGQASPEYWDMAELKGSLLFVARTGRLNYGLYRTDGSAATTQLLFDFSYRRDPGSLRLYPPLGGLETIGDLVYFSHSGALWSSDGTPAGTTQRTQLLTGDMEGLGGAAYFLSLSRPYGQDLARPGESLSADVIDTIAPTLTLGQGRMVAMGGRLYVGVNGEGRAELWVTDGSERGAFPVAAWRGRVFGQTDLSDGQQPVVALGERLFFVADDGVHGGELWVSDGTPAGTVQLKDINPAP